MKIRNGFVSNSSSSSFVVIAPKNVVDKVLNKLPTEYEKAAVKYIMTTTTFLGKEVCVFQGMSGNEDSWEYDFSPSDYDDYVSEDDEDGEPSPYPYEVFEEFTEELKKETKDIIEAETNC